MSSTISRALIFNFHLERDAAMTTKVVSAATGVNVTETGVVHQRAVLRRVMYKVPIVAKGKTRYTFALTSLGKALHPELLIDPRKHALLACPVTRRLLLYFKSNKKPVGVKVLSDLFKSNMTKIRTVLNKLTVLGILYTRTRNNKVPRRLYALKDVTLLDKHIDWARISDHEIEQVGEDGTKGVTSHVSNILDKKQDLPKTYTHLRGKKDMGQWLSYLQNAKVYAHE